MEKQEIIIRLIKEKWQLPEEYIEFLERNFDNVYVNREETYGDETFITEVEIFGARDLIRGQEGYSFNPVTNEAIVDWNPNYVVIANSGADPYCIDISLEKSPVYYAMHGAGVWDFSEEFQSLTEFLTQFKLG